MLRPGDRVTVRSPRLRWEFTGTVRDADNAPLTDAPMVFVEPDAGNYPVSGPPGARWVEERYCFQAFDRRTITPGPWSVDDDPASPTITVHAAEGVGGMIADVCRTPDPGRDGTANAWLISAAPDLLAACESLLERVRDLDDSGPPGETWQSDELKAEIAAARAAIRAARGEADAEG